MSPEIKNLCKEENIKKIEEAVQEESGILISLSKRYFWNGLVMIFFFLHLLLYIFLTEQPQRIVMIISGSSLLLASFERLYIQRRIKLKVSKLATFSAIVEFLKNIKKNESISSR